MPAVRRVRTLWIVSGLALGFAAVLAVPVLAFWDVLQPALWNATTLKAEFQSIRYESGGLVFRYAVHNSSRHAADFQPTLTEIHALQAKDTPPVGFPNVLLPFSVPGGGSHVLEVHLELTGSARMPPVAAPTLESSLQEALIELNGFELVDETAGVRLLLPRGW